MGGSPAEEALSLVLPALLSAEAHVVRQQSHGKHDQDRADAIAWVEKFGGLMHQLRGYGFEGDDDVQE